MDFEKRIPRDPRKYPTSLLNWEETTKNPQRLFDVINDVLELKGLHIRKDEKILEIGSGQGGLLDFLNTRGYDAVGVDGRPRHFGELPVALARIEQLPFQDNTFQTIISASVFDDEVYNQNSAQMLSEIYRVLKKDGLYVSIGDNHPDQVSPEQFEPIFNTGLRVYRKK